MKSLALLALLAVVVVLGPLALVAAAFLPLVDLRPALEA